MKKFLSTLLLVVIVFNFIFCNFTYADDVDDATTKKGFDTQRYGGNSTLGDGDAETVVYEGTDKNGNSMDNNNFGDSIIGMLLQSVASLINIFPYAIETMLSIVTSNPDSAGGMDFIQIASMATGDAEYFYSIERTVFNEISILNANIFNDEESYTVGHGAHKKTINQNNVLTKLKESVVGWFYTIRLLAMMINLCVLIYVGIRMAGSSIASEEAKYKKMLIFWAESMIVLFLLHYIMYAVMFMADFLLDIIITLREAVIDNKQGVSFETTLIESVFSFMMIFGGTKYALYSIFFWFLTALHLKFFFTYFKRMLTIFFLVVISPFITVTYPIDKIGDGRAQAYEQWLKEFVINVMIQPIHAIAYLVFAYTAGRIAEQAPMVGMIFLLALGRVENIIRNVFKITDSVNNVNDARKRKKGGGLPFMRMLGKAKG